MPSPTPESTPARVLLDAAQGPLDPVARDTLLAAVDAGWADPRRLHREGRQAALLLDRARELLADGLGVRPDELSLHPSGTHALLTGVRGLRRARRRVGEALVTSVIDQAALLREPAPLTGVPVDASGRLDDSAWRTAVSAAGVAVAALAVANGEIGTTQHLDAAAQACVDAGVPLLLDATSAWGRLPLPLHGQVYAADAASFAGPPLGVLAVRTGTRFAAEGPVSGPERGREPAPPLVPLALAAAEAWQQGAAARAHDTDVAAALVDRIRMAAAGVPDVEVVGDPVERLPHVVTFSALYVDGETLVHEFDRRGFAVASGSACTADTLEPSHVLAGIGALTHGNVRITLPLPSLHPTLTDGVERFCAELPDVIATVRAHLGTDRL